MSDNQDRQVCAVCHRPAGDVTGENKLISVFGALPGGNAAGTHLVHPHCRERVNENVG